MAVSGGRIVARIVASMVLLVVVIGAVLAYQHRQEISDHFAAQGFTASAEISDLASSLLLTDAGTRIFFASSPTLDASQQFNEQCSQVDHSEEGHVLGCFTSGEIHLFKVTDERLNGIVEVTAAHELLHATFSRLGSEERDELSEKLLSTFEELSAADATLARRMDVYSGLTGTAFANELHSVLGTEVRELPEWLEAHYAQWFRDRSVIVDFFDSYHHVFTELRERADHLQAQLETMRADIEARSAAYDSAVAAFNSEWAVFLERNEAFEFSDNPAEFYAIRDAFDARRMELNAQLASLNADIASYEELRVELQQLGELNTELQANLNSELAPPATAPTG